jgi:hypothetical protein
MHLTTNMRILSTSEESPQIMQDAREFADWLLEIGEGKRNEGTKVSLLPGISLYIDPAKCI